MKNKLSIEFVASEKFVGDLPVNAADQHPETRSGNRRDLSAPKIVVCPPMEEITGPISAPRGGRLMRALGRRLPRRSTDEDSLDSSSSSDSGSEQRAPDRSSGSTSDSSSDGSERQRRPRSTVSLRRVFQSLNLTARSNSCSPTERTGRNKKQQQPKRILRQPVSYTYVRGLSGLPTQRVPRHTVFCAPSGLNR